MYLYYAIFTPETDGGYSIEFPDLEGAFSCGNDMHDSLYMAKDLLEGWLIVAEDEGDNIPQPSSPSEISIQPNELLIPIEVNLSLARQKHENTLIKKTLTIPEYLNVLAMDNGINFSQTLTEALREKLGV
ncbi:type II toxin-antitoxin system HicB family antitoxin [Dolosicoccus paucivorans]|uniref:HicB family protein n=1 Tax=Dolosicoccus paucivorans TaxID=84521 RepID=A0A2N6SKZ6_9LACT|nr:type II toxin-antitoxin system HicB family antitoxin [Dolosicoccus paucivorans]PMB83607.1 HicB family protein [Dolosicoccus paucivorans]PMC57189.1 HicB family protein [Dolosicoccus paucivorans]